MTNYYVRTAANGGSDAAAGTSAGAAWATIGKALGAAGISSGDTVYIGAGRYDEVVSVAMVSAVAETSVIGDTSGQYTGDAGEVAWTGWTSGLDAAPAATATLTLANRDYLTFENICFYGGSAQTGAVNGDTTMSTNITFRNCAFLAAAGARNGHRVGVTVTGLTNAAWLFDRCLWFGSATSCLVATLTTSGTVDYDANIVLQNCTLMNFSGSGTTISVTNSGTSAGKGGGVYVHNCTIFCAGAAAVNTPATHISTTYPVYVRNCHINAGGSTALNAGTLGQIVEDYNVLTATTRSANVSAGANSRYEDGFFAFNVGQHRIWGGYAKPFLSPVSVGGGASRLLGRGTDAGVSLTVDGVNRPRPAGGSTTKAAGAFERHDTATNNSPNGHKITGPGDQDIYFAVPASATTITITAEYDTNHAATNKPQAILLANGERGVAEQTVTMTAAVNTEEDIVIGPFTPTSAGVVTVRLRSRSAAANGIAQFKVAVPS